MSIRTTTSQGSLTDFLASAKSTLSHAIQKKDKVTLVIGNENADTDSVVSAILFSYFRSATPPTKAFTQTYVPLAQLSETEVASRSALSRLLEVVGLKASDLITLEDIVKRGENTQSGLIADNTRIFLVGQNKLVGRMGENYSKNIIGCIDHHPEENYVPKETGPEPRIIGKSATSTSLVVNHSQSAWGTLKGERAEWDSQLAKLALGTILVDTQDMRTGGNMSEEDERAVKFLESKISHGTDGSPFNRGSFYQSLTGSSTTGVGSTASRQPTTSSSTTTATSAAAIGGAAAAGGAGGLAAERVANHATKPAYAASSSYTATRPAAGAGYSNEELPVWLEGGFREYPASGGSVVGISTIDRSLSELIDQSERDVAHKALSSLSISGTGATSTPSTTSTGHQTAAGSMEVKTGSPFTAAVREFVTGKGCSIFGLLTTNHDLTAKGYDPSKLTAPHGNVGTSSGTSGQATAPAQSTGGIASTITSFFTGSSSTTAPETVTTDATTTTQRTEHDPAATTAYTNPTSAAEEAALTDVPGRKEIFLWVLDPKLGAAMPAFIERYSEALGLSKWEGDQEIVKEMGMYDGLMRVYWIGAENVGEEVVAGMLGESLTGADGSYVGKGL